MISKRGGLSSPLSCALSADKRHNKIIQLKFSFLPQNRIPDDGEFLPLFSVRSCFFYRFNEAHQLLYTMSRVFVLISVKFVFSSSSISISQSSQDKFKVENVIWNFVIDIVYEVDACVGINFCNSCERCDTLATNENSTSDNVDKQRMVKTNSNA